MTESMTALFPPPPAFPPAGDARARRGSRSLRPVAAQPRATLEPTPRDAEGPFYPTRIPADADSDLTRVAGRARRRRERRSRSRDASWAPMASRWPARSSSCGSATCYGRYHHVDGDPGTRDENFQGYGVTSTDGDGRFAFRTIRPVPYGGRPPHLHFKLAHARAQPLTTQIYPRGESAERGSGFGLSGRGDALAGWNSC